MAGWGGGPQRGRQGQACSFPGGTKLLLLALVLMSSCRLAYGDYGDGVQDGSETDIDCGSGGTNATAPKCTVGQKCLVGADCDSGICRDDNLRCAELITCGPLLNVRPDNLRKPFVNFNRFKAGVIWKDWTTKQPINDSALQSNLGSAIELQGKYCSIVLNITGCVQLDFLWGEMDYTIVGGWPGKPRMFFVSVPEMGLLAAPVNILAQLQAYYQYVPGPLGWSLTGKLQGKATVIFERRKDKPIISGFRVTQLDSDSCLPLNPPAPPLDIDLGTDEFLPPGVCVDCSLTSAPSWGIGTVGGSGK